MFELLLTLQHLTGCGVNTCIRLDSGDGNNNNEDTEANDWLMVLAASHKYTGPTNNNNNEGDLSNRFAIFFCINKLSNHFQPEVTTGLSVQKKKGLLY